MSDLISRSALLEDIKATVRISSRDGLAMEYGEIRGAKKVLQRIEAAPTVDAVPVVHGRWEEWWPGISVIMTGEEMLYRCSVCTAKYADIDGYDYCPNCGAKMDGGEDDG